MGKKSQEKNVIHELIKLGVFDMRVPGMRKLYNEEIDRLVSHMLEYGNRTPLIDFVDAVTPPQYQRELFRKLYAYYPLKPHPKKGYPTVDKEAVEAWKKPTKPFDFSGAIKFGYENPGTVYLHSVELTVDEFISLFVDLLVLKRHEINVSQINDIASILQKILSQKSQESDIDAKR